MKIFVTGVAGFIGFHLVKNLLKNKTNVIVGIDNINDYYSIELKYARLQVLGVDSSQASHFNKRVTSQTGNFTFYRAHLEDEVFLETLFEKHQFDQVVHLAAQAGVRYSIKNPKSYIQSNIVGFANVLECCRNFKIKHFIYASSSSVYGQNKKVPFHTNDQVDRPISLYAATKKSNELMAHTYSHLYDLPTTGLRFFTVYGPWGRPDMAPYLFADAILNNREIKVFNHGKMKRDFTYIDDIIQGFLIVLNNVPCSQPPYELANIGKGVSEPLMDFIEALEDNTQKQAQKKYLPMQPGDVPQTWSDTSYLNKIGYQPQISMQQGVAKFVEWYRDYHNK